MTIKIYQSLAEKKQRGKKSFAVLIDPDKVNTALLDELIELSTTAGVDYFLVGGSLVISSYLDDCVQYIKKISDIPIILFPRTRLNWKKASMWPLYLKRFKPSIKSNQLIPKTD